MSVKIITGDCRDVLRTLPDESVHCVVTSPPYWGLRSYGVGTDNGEIGLEPSLGEYIDTMVAVFREVRRVLRKDGTLWLNLGDSYSSHDPGGYREGEFLNPNGRPPAKGQARNRAGNYTDLPRKNLIGIPWRLAFALQQPYYTGRIKNEIDRVWLAAMIDAEGCIFIHKRKEGNKHGTYEKNDGTISEYMRSGDNYGAGLEIANTHESVIQRCLQITGQGSFFRHDKDRRQPLWRWNMRSNECREIIREIYPYLVAKQHQARLLLGCPSSGPKAEAAHQGLINLHNGKPVDVDFPPPASMFEPGWYLRQDCIWSKLNPMPESVTDRCTKAHEYLFLLTKAANYYYDAEAIKEPQSDGTHERFGEDGQRSTNTPKATSPGQGIKNNRSMDAALKNMVLPNGRNKRSVWEIATAPFSEAHFATFPPALIEPCIKAGTSEKGCCAKCGKPWVRQIEYGDLVPTRHYPNKRAYGVVIDNPDPRDLGRARARTGHRAGMAYEAKTLGWSPSCACNAEVVPCTVLDPFAGAGTTGLVADRLGRNAVLIELNPTYAAMAERRLRDDAGMFANVGDYDGNADFAKSYETCLAAVRERVVAGGPSWEPAEPPVTDDGPLFAWAREAAE